MKAKHTQGTMVAKYDVHGGYDCMYSAICLDIEGAHPPFEGSDEPQDQTVAVLDRRDYDRVNSWEEDAGVAPDPEMVANGDRMALCWNMHDELVAALERMTTAAAVVDNLHAAGVKLNGNVWSDIYTARNHARAVLDRVREEGAGDADS